MRTIMLTLISLAALAGVWLRASIDVRDDRDVERGFGIMELASNPVESNTQEASAAEDDSVSFRDVIRTPSSIGEVVFPHLEHVDDFGMECVECHHEVNAVALHIPHQEYFEDFWIDCQTCHGNHRPANEAISCSKCHHDRPSGVSDETLSSKVVIHKNCWDCHEVGTGADASAECVMCHSGPKEPYGPLEPPQ